MFTGIVTDMGKIVANKLKGDSIKFLVEPTIRQYLNDIKTGDSIAINGACMTVESKKGNKFEFTTIRESLSKTNLGDLKTGSYVNLEKPMRINSKLDGHIVQGHVDATGIVKKINRLKDSWEFFIEFSSKFRNNIIYVGSISINGVSLTIAQLVKETKKSVTVKVAIIPHTFEVTNFRYFKPGTKVNIEFDMMGKYVMRKLEGTKPKKIRK
ncbi:MAG: riboflavin synthase [Ignavibacteriae bacterium]|nr:riboflavin synthase [Ignavibacteriota bacterium]